MTIYPQNKHSFTTFYTKTCDYHSILYLLHEVPHFCDCSTRYGCCSKKGTRYGLISTRVQSNM